MSAGFPFEEDPSESLDELARSKSEQTIDFDLLNSVSATSDTRPTIPNYRLERVLGSGGFGKVYLARRMSDDQPFALKMMHVEHELKMELKQRFLREATVLSQLRHPRIVKFHELGMTDHGFYLVMDYVDHIAWNDLKLQIAESRHIRVAVKIIDHCLDALDFAHKQNVVHRDIKPSNILLQSHHGQIRVLLADFGMAKNYSHAGHSGMTSDDDIAGTFGFMAPELLGGVRYFQPESDQYAVAATLYAMICDRPPVQFTRGGNPLMELRRHQVPRIESLAPDIPRNLASWIHRGLTPDPADRFKSVSEMRRQLRSIYKEFEKKTQ